MCVVTCTQAVLEVALGFGNDLAVVCAARTFCLWHFDRVAWSHTSKLYDVCLMCINEALQCGQVLLHVGPDGVKVARVLELAHLLGLASEKWGSPEDRKARHRQICQISHVLRSTAVFVRLGSRNYAIAALPAAEATTKATSVQGRHGNSVLRFQHVLSMRDRNEHLVQSLFCHRDHTRCRLTNACVH